MVIPQSVVNTYSKEANENEIVCRHLIRHHIDMPQFDSRLLHLLCDFYSATSVIRETLSQIGEEDFFDEKTQKTYHYISSVQLAALSACITITQNCEADLSKNSISLKTH